MQSLATVLKDPYGLSIKGITLLGADAISSDGLWVTGFGVLEGKPGDGSHGYVAAIPNFAARASFLSGKLDHLADGDGDGLGNTVEISLGSDPFDPSSQPRLDIEIRGDTIAIQVPVASGLNLSVLPWRLDEAANVWTSQGITWEVITPGIRKSLRIRPGQGAIIGFRIVVAEEP